jgi:hypothetical protein
MMKAFKTLLLLFGFGPSKSPEKEQVLMEQGNAPVHPTTSTELVGSCTRTTHLAHSGMPKEPNNAILEQIVPAKTIKILLQQMGCFKHRRDLPTTFDGIFEMASILLQQSAFPGFLPVAMATRPTKMQWHSLQRHANLEIYRHAVPIAGLLLSRIRSGCMLGIIETLDRSWHLLRWSGSMMMRAHDHQNRKQNSALLPGKIGRFS